MKIATMQVNQPVVMAQFYRDLASPKPAKYEVDLKSEAPALEEQIAALPPAAQLQYQQTFVATWNNLSPATRQTILGGAAGGAAGAGLAIATVGIKEISRLLGGPVGFVVGVTVMGVVGGAITSKTLEHFRDSGIKGKVQTPALWNLVLPSASFEFQGKTAKAPAATKRPAATKATAAAKAPTTAKAPSRGAGSKA